MKLFTKYNYINIASTVFMFLVASIAFYFVLQQVLIKQLDETLVAEKWEMINYIEEHNQLPEITNTRHQWIKILPASGGNLISSKQTIITLNTFNKREKEVEQIRQLSFFIKVKDQYYLIQVNKSQTETEDLLKLIIIVALLLIGGTLVLNYIINRTFVSKLWQPFYNTIQHIQSYKISTKHPLQLPKEKIDEINLLNESLNTMSETVFNEYQALKTFTENASHEMQTPLAVIRSKIELLLQHHNLEEQQMKQLLSIEESTHKLAKLHQSLLLLTKLENNQFIINETIDFGLITQQKISERKELFEAKKIKLTEEISPVKIVFHHHLAEILINNLLNNALKFTPINGEVIIQITSKYICIANTAITGGLAIEKVFSRFYKPSQNQEGTGLGLAIIKEITKLAGFEVVYKYYDEKHNFTIYFKPDN